MHILTLILIFVVGAIAAVCHGDFSGIWAIAKWIVIGGVVIFLILHPEFLVILGIAVVGFLIWVIFGDDPNDPGDDLTIH